MLEVHIRPAFSPGQLVATNTAMSTVPEKEFGEAIVRHLLCDWGDVSEADWKTNNESLFTGERLLSVYHTKSDTTFWIITEADRSLTTVLLPSDY